MKHRRFRHRWTQRLLLMGGVLIGGLLIACLGVSLWIGSGVEQASMEARQRYEGDRVEALVQQVADEGRTFRERNRAVWALGQLGDPRALATVRSDYTGEPCDHEHSLCQRELAKAIKLLEGDLNVSALVWR